MKQIDFDKVLVIIFAIAAWLVVMILLSPCLLIFTEGKDGGITIWNFVGIAYLLGVIWIVGHVIKRAKRSSVEHEIENYEQTIEDMRSTQTNLAEKVVELRKIACCDKDCKNRLELKEDGAAK